MKREARGGDWKECSVAESMVCSLEALVQAPGTTWFPEYNWMNLWDQR